MKKPLELIFCQKLYPQLLSLVLKEFDSETIKKEFLDKKGYLTETDVKTDKLIVNAINKAFPEDLVFSEEGQTKITEKKRFWLVDPICGTRNFANGVLFFNTNIILFEDYKPVFAFVLDYSKKTYYWANRENPGIYIKEQIAKKELILDIPRIISINPGYLNLQGTKEEIKMFAEISCQLLKERYYLANPFSSLCFTYTALARRGGLILFGTKPWDFAAASYLIEKNGGVVTDFSGQPWSLDSKNIVASLDKNIHQKLLTTIQKTYKSI